VAIDAAADLSRAVHAMPDIGDMTVAVFGAGDGAPDPSARSILPGGGSRLATSGAISG
jgi:hypothetical protein